MAASEARTWITVSAPLWRSANTAPAAILRMIPGVTDDDVGAWLREREERPFASDDDFLTRIGAAREFLDALDLDPW